MQDKAKFLYLEWKVRENKRTKGKNLCQSTPITIQQCLDAKHCIGRASFKNQCGECIRLSREVSYYIVLSLSGETRLSNSIPTNIHLLSCWHYDVITFLKGHAKVVLNDCFHWPGRSSGLQQNISELLTLDPSSSKHWPIGLCLFAYTLPLEGWGWGG